jgi:uracil-DNA glycosylase family 4
VCLNGPGLSVEPAGIDMGIGENMLEERLSELEARVRTCVACELHRGRTHAVFGKGDPMAKVMFIGEGPGRDEDQRGEPFVGRSGQLLTKILGAIDLQRDDVYITNIVKCRPPQNRDPLEEEVRCCEKYLIEQIELMKPRLICALGRISAQWLLGTKEPLAALRRAENSYRGTPVLVTYHPAALLRNPELKREAWEDFKKLKSLIEEE